MDNNCDNHKNDNNHNNNNNDNCNNNNNHDNHNNDNDIKNDDYNNNINTNNNNDYIFFTLKDLSPWTGSLDDVTTLILFEDRHISKHSSMHVSE